MHRRDFLRAGLAGASAFASFLPDRLRAADRPVTFVVDPADAVASSSQAQWALGELQRALTDAGLATRVVPRIEQGGPADLLVMCAAQQGAAVPGPERLSLRTERRAGRDVLLVAGSDPAGLVYGLLELTDRLRTGAAATTALAASTAIAEAPANPVRSVMRQFTSDVLDKPWFYDREMWPEYLSMLAGHRFNRLHLAFGLGYDSLQRVTDSYFLFLYPFLVDVPGYQVRVSNVSGAERDRNLEMLRWISEQTVARGLTFQLGIWMHGYTLTDSPAARYLVEGLTRATHAEYCRDALTAVLRACPAISAVALRIHGESGIAEGSYDFWQTVFDGVPRAGRKVEIDLHAKGLDHRMIDRALATGMPVNVSPKYWAEHLGMPYHQAAIRELEMPVEGHTGRGLMTLSEGSLSFTRYGYADFLRDDRRYTVRHRVFAGTQRLLASGDPEAAAAYGKAFGFCGSAGVDLMEPLTCRGRRGTGVAGQRRSGYADATLEPRWDWQKYGQWYRTWGRLTYNPAADADQCRRGFPAGPPATALAAALARASRVLPIVTTAYTPSAACDAYWPEVYWNQPLAAEPRPNWYGDTPAPKTFQHASPLDPQLFTTAAQCAAELMTGRRSGRYTPIDAAFWLQDLAAAIDADLARAGDPRSADDRRLAVDIRMQAGLARFFAAKFRAGVLYAIHEHGGTRAPLDAALSAYREARGAWSTLTAAARGIYADDLSVSDKLSERGQWSDRLAAIDADIAALTARQASAAAETPGDVAAAVALTARRPPRTTPACRHTPPSSLAPGSGMPLELRLDGHTGSVHCYYRHVNQAERFVRMEMSGSGGAFRSTIPASYTSAPYPVQYYFVVSENTDQAALFPGLGRELMGEPYFVVRRA